MLELLVQGDGIAAELHYFPIDADAAEAFLLYVGKQLGEFALTAHHHRRHDQRFQVVAQGHDLVGNLIGCLGLDFPPAFRAMGNAHTGEEESQVVVDFGYRSDRGTGILARCLLVDGNRRGQSVDLVDIGLAHLAEEHTRVAGEAFDISALAFGIDGIECKRGLSRTGKTRDDHQLVTGNGDIYVLQVMLACTFDDD